MFFLYVTLLISVGLIGYWYFFDRSPIEQPSPQYIKPALNFQSIDWVAFNNNLMKVGYVDFFELYPLEMYADIFGIDILGLKEIYNNEERFKDLAHDMMLKFEEDKVIFHNFFDQMQQCELKLNVMPIEFNFDHSGVDHHYDSVFDHNNFNNPF